MVIVVPAVDISDQNLYPAITFLVTLCAKDVPRVRLLSLPRFDDQERMSIFVILVNVLGGTCALLPPNLCSRYRNQTQMCTAPLAEPSVTTRVSARVAYRFIVLQYTALEDKIPPLPATEVFTPFSQVTLFVSSWCNWLTSTNYVGREKRGDFVSVSERKRKDCLEVRL